MVLGKLDWTATCKRMKLNQLYHTQKSEWIKDINVRLEAIKLLEENIGSNFSDISNSNIFLDRSPEARETKTKINYWDSTKTKSFYTAKETINKKATC